MSRTPDFFCWERINGGNGGSGVGHRTETTARKIRSIHKKRQDKKRKRQK